MKVQFPSIKVSLVSKATTPIVIENLDFSDLIKSIKYGLPLMGEIPFVATIKKIRSLLDQGPKNDLVKQLKLSLPKVFPHIILPKGSRIGENVSEFSGIIHFDIDNIAPNDMTSISDVLKHLDIHSFCKSPSNRGFKVFFMTSLQGETQGKEQLFKAVWQALAIKVDEALATISSAYKVDLSQKSVNSGFFITQDDNVYEHSDPKVIKIEDLDLVLDLQKTKPIKASKASNPKKIEWSGLFPSEVEILNHIQWLSMSKQESAINSIKEYFATPRLEGKRYAAFFKMASILCKLGVSRGGQYWNQDCFEKLLSLLDYDGSRRSKNAITTTLTSLKAYGHFENQVKQGDSNESLYVKHLESFAKPDVKLSAKKFVSECHIDLMHEISSHRIVSLDAKPGAGKTSWIFQNMLNDFDGRIFLILPFRSLLAELQSKYVNDNRIQFLVDGQKIDPSKKMIVLTFEKMLDFQKDIGASDALIFDEIHLLGQNFRCSTSRQLINIIRNSDSRCILLSATMQALLSSIKSHMRIRYIKIDTEAALEKISIKIVSGTDIVDWSIAQIANNLKINPTEKILCFKNDRSMLFEIQAKLLELGIGALVVTRDTRSDSNIRCLWEGHIPEGFQVILSTSIAEIGVTLPFITKTLILGKQYSTEQVVQIANRSRNENALVDWILPKEKKKLQTQFLSCFGTDFLSEYQLDAEEWVRLEQKRFKLLYPSGKITNLRFTSDYIRALDNTITSDDNDESVRFKNLCQIVQDTAGKWKIDFNLQGWAQNLIYLERKNEQDLKYVSQKLETLWNISVDISYVEESRKAKAKVKKSTVNLWDVLRKYSDSHSIEEILSNLTEILEKHGAAPHEIYDMQHQIENRLNKIVLYELSLQEYIFVPSGEFQRILDLALIKFTPQDLHPIENSLAKIVTDHALIGKVLYQDQMADLIDRLIIPNDAIHIYEVVKNFSRSGKSRWVRKLLLGQNIRRINPLTGKKERGLLVEGLAWENLEIDTHSRWKTQASTAS